MVAHRWNYPASWLEERLDECSHEETDRIARLQDLFQDEMDEDGYFEDLDREPASGRER